LRYVEDAAENYAIGVFKNIKDFWCQLNSWLLLI
jgi:hypothetical protein